MVPFISVAILSIVWKSMVSVENDTASIAHYFVLLAQWAVSRILKRQLPPQSLSRAKFLPVEKMSVSAWSVEVIGLVLYPYFGKHNLAIGPVPDTYGSGAGLMAN